MASKAIPLAAVGGALLLARRTMRNLGATKTECRSVLPGDELVPDPAVLVTRAVTVEAPAEQVWQWLIQIGQDRGGFYSYENLENAFGLDIHNAGRVHPEWQDLAVGDEVRLAPKGLRGMPDGLALKVAAIVAGESLVLYEEPWSAVWSFHVHARGPNRCRLLSRSRSPRTRGVSRLAGELLDPVTLLMTRKMLRGIKARAEWAHAHPAEAVGPEGAEVS